MEFRPTISTQQLAELYFEQGHSLEEIARQLGLGLTTVWRRLTDAGFKLRACGTSLVNIDDALARLALRCYRHVGLGRWINLAQASFLRIQPCFYCTSPPSNTMKTVREHGEDITCMYQGIDQVVRGRGHVIGNVLPCCWGCNRGKSDMTLEEFCAWTNRRRAYLYWLTPEEVIHAAARLGEKLRALSSRATHRKAA